jgi:hypothetical protein
MAAFSAAVARSPVFGVPAGSISSRCVSSWATGQCSMPFGTTYDALRNDIKVTGTTPHVAVPHPDRECALEDNEQIVRIRMRVPDELAFDLDHHYVMPIEPGDDLR